MSKMRKLLAILLTFAMVLGMSITTFAATPVEADNADVTVQKEVETELKKLKKVMNLGKNNQ